MPTKLAIIGSVESVSVSNENICFSLQVFIISSNSEIFVIREYLLFLVSFFSIFLIPKSFYNLFKLYLSIKEDSFFSSLC